jgi:hypothetical protein
MNHAGDDKGGLWEARATSEIGVAHAWGRRQQGHGAKGGSSVTTWSMWKTSRRSNAFFRYNMIKCTLLDPRLHNVTRVASPALYWPADEVGSQTPGRLRPGDLNLYYNSCHILSIWLVEINRCLVLHAKSCGHFGLGRLVNLLEGILEVVWATN